MISSACFPPPKDRAQSVVALGASTSLRLRPYVKTKHPVTFLRMHDLDWPCRDEAAASFTPSQLRKLTKAMRYIRTNFTKQPRLGAIAAEAEISPFHFHRLFRKCYGRTFKQIMTELQIEHAKELLEKGIPTREAGTLSGFANQSHFTSRFKTVTGTTPAVWNRQRRASLKAQITP